jgi:hypothetical protein
MLRKLVFERDFEGRDALMLLSYYEIDEIMNNKNMEKVALELWTSEYDIKGTIMECSSAYQILVKEGINKPKDMAKEYIFYNWESSMGQHENGICIHTFQIHFVLQSVCHQNMNLEEGMIKFKFHVATAVLLIIFNIIFIR